jgi:hypothetical protein
MLEDERFGKELLVSGDRGTRPAVSENLYPELVTGVSDEKPPMQLPCQPPRPLVCVAEALSIASSSRRRIAMNRDRIAAR